MICERENGEVMQPNVNVMTNIWGDFKICVYVLYQHA